MSGGFQDDFSGRYPVLFEFNQRPASNFVFSPQLRNFVLERFSPPGKPLEANKKIIKIAKRRSSAISLAACERNPFTIMDSSASFSRFQSGNSRFHHSTQNGLFDLLRLEKTRLYLRLSYEASPYTIRVGKL